jgi:DNA-binding MarR family transcriptional regulator
MKLERELGLRTGIKTSAHEALLNIYHTGDVLKKRAREFFARYGVTDVQFNLMELLYYQADEKVGLTQADLSKMLVVNRSNVTTLIDRMEKGGLVVRVDVPGDRRYHAVQLTHKGRSVLEAVEDTYMAEVKKVMEVLTEPERKALIASLERIREGIRTR